MSKAQTSVSRSSVPSATSKRIWNHCAYLAAGVPIFFSSPKVLHFLKWKHGIGAFSLQALIRFHWFGQLAVEAGTEEPWPRLSFWFMGATSEIHREVLLSSPVLASSALVYSSANVSRGWIRETESILMSENLTRYCYHILKLQKNTNGELRGLGVNLKSFSTQSSN